MDMNPKYLNFKFSLLCRWILSWGCEVGEFQNFDIYIYQYWGKKVDVYRIRYDDKLIIKKSIIILNSPQRDACRVISCLIE